MLTNIHQVFVSISYYCRCVLRYLTGNCTIYRFILPTGIAITHLVTFCVSNGSLHFTDRIYLTFGSNVTMLSFDNVQDVRRITPDVIQTLTNLFDNDYQI